MYRALHCQISASEKFSINYLHRHSSWNLVRANIFQRIISSSMTTSLAVWNKFSLTAFYWHRVILFNVCFRLSTGSWAAYGKWHIHIILPTTEHPCNDKMLYMNMRFKKGKKTEGAIKLGIKMSDSGSCWNGTILKVVFPDQGDLNVQWGVLLTEGTRH